MFRTRKGVFSSPVIDGDGTTYVGSADRTFYAIDRDGSLKWKFSTGEIIDSAALLDDEGRVIFGSGDGTLYAPNDNFCTYGVRRSTGERVWCARAYDQTWSLPALDPASGRLFLGNNFAFLYNTFARDVLRLLG